MRRDHPGRRELQRTSASASNTVVGLSIAGVPVGSIPVGSIPVGSIAGGHRRHPGRLDPGRQRSTSRATPLAAILLRTIPNVNSVVDCARISCTGNATLGDAAALTPSAIRPTATLASLQAVLGTITLNEIIIGIVPAVGARVGGVPDRRAPALHGHAQTAHVHASTTTSTARGRQASRSRSSSRTATSSRRGRAGSSYGINAPSHRSEPDHERDDGRALGEPARPVSGRRDDQARPARLPGVVGVRHRRGHRRARR